MKSYGRLLRSAFWWHALNAPPTLGKTVDREMSRYFFDGVFEVEEGDVVGGFVSVRVDRRRVWLPQHLIVPVDVRAELSANVELCFGPRSAGYNDTHRMWVLGEEIRPGQKLYRLKPPITRIEVVEDFLLGSAMN